MNISNVVNEIKNAKPITNARDRERLTYDIVKNYNYDAREFSGAIIHSYSNVDGKPYIQMLLENFENFEIRKILMIIGLGGFQGDVADLINIINCISLVNWDISRASEISKYNRSELINLTGKTYLQCILAYVTGEYVTQVNYTSRKRFREFQAYGDKAPYIMLAIYLVYFYYSNRGAIVPSDIFERVTRSEPKLYEKYIIQYITDGKQKVLNTLEMVPTDDELSYFLESLPQYESIISGSFGKTDKYIMNNNGIIYYGNHNELEERAVPLKSIKYNVLLICHNPQDPHLHNKTRKAFSDLGLKVNKIYLDYVAYETMRITNKIYKLGKEKGDKFPNEYLFDIFPPYRYNYVVYEHCPYHIYKPYGELLNKFHKKVLKDSGKIIKIGIDQKGRNIMSHHRVLNKTETYAICVPE